MNTSRQIRSAAENGEKALNEAQAKSLLASFGVPTVSERLVLNEDEAAAAAEEIGFPVVLKGVGKALLHKTEKGAVCLDLSDGRQVTKAARRMQAALGTELDGFLVQPRLSGKRELVAGLFHDSQFGAVVMLGIGGIFTEAFADVTFRLVPASEADILAMIGELQAQRLLGSFRGEAAVKTRQLVDVIKALSAIAIQHPEIAEVDINPLIVSADGDLTAVDAMVSLRKPPPPIAGKPPVTPDRIGHFFFPRSIAFVGASATLGKWGHTLFTMTAANGFSGAIYLVNPKAETIANRPVYPSIRHLPEKVDLAVVTVPAERVLALLPDLAAKGIKNMLLITSGFGETGDAGKKLEKQLIDEAAARGILVGGPNTMGICNPHINLYCTGSHVAPRPGSTVVVAQSGNMGTQLLAFAEQQGIGIRGFCGSGNEAMVTIEDYLDAFYEDDTTRTVMLYIESVKNGPRFFECASRVSRKKPIVLLKGGQSGVGNRAAASHTGAMASDSRIFNAVCRQAGIVKVEQPMDLLDLAAAFSSLPLPAGKRVAIMTLGGGWGVVTADLCATYGLEVPELDSDLITRFDAILPPYWSRTNPVDIVGENDPELPKTILEALLAWEGCDAVINLGILGRRILVQRLINSVKNADPTCSRDDLDSVDLLVEEVEKDYIRHIVAMMEKYHKPVLGVSLLTDSRSLTVNRVPDSPLKGIFYQTPERAVKACARMAEYRTFKDNIQ